MFHVSERKNDVMPKFELKHWTFLRIEILMKHKIQPLKQIYLQECQ